jgi:hypothetical protein
MVQREGDAKAQRPARRTYADMGMDSERLSQRRRQPGHDRTFRTSETNFVDAARRCLDSKRYEVDDRPRDLLECFGLEVGARALGLQPEASITSRQTGRKFFVEVKKQGPQGNAEERAFKHHTVQFYKLLREQFGYPYHPYVTIWCESLAVLPRYTRKAVHLFEPNQYFLWVDYELEPLCEYLGARCAAWLDG